MPVTVGFLRRLRREERGNSLVEFALATPVVLLLGGYGVELANLAIVNLRISSVALQLADNASRIGVNNGQAIYQLREGDINDVLQGARLLGQSLNLTKYGRVTLSSLENIQQQNFSDHAADTAPVQRIHWQRCMGQHTGYDSSYGTTPTTAGSNTSYANAGTPSSGMGDSPQVNAPAGSAMIFVEVNYEYHPVFGTTYMNAQKIHYVASFVVRDRRDFSQIFNPTAPGGTPQPVASTCDKYNV